jgi:hypothetical protein
MASYGSFIGHERLKHYTSPAASLTFQRGDVLSTSLSPELHEIVCRWRDCLDPLTGGTDLRFYLATSGRPFSYESGDGYFGSGDSEKISPHDMHSFTWHCQSSNAMNSETACLGFATARVEPSDRIYQFAATRIALVIRLSGTGVSVIARALLMPAEFAVTDSLV